MATSVRPLAGRRLLVGVSGGIAAYKAVELVRLLAKPIADGGAGAAEVRVVMTRSARRFVTPLTFQTLSGHPVGTTLWDLTQESEIGHIALAQRAEVVIVAPATADLIGRYAGGLADDLLTTILLATRAPVLVAPAMNPVMYAHPAVQANVATLRQRGVVIVEPEVGPLASRAEAADAGPGRMAEPAAIVEAAEDLVTPKDLAGLRVLVTAGPTREPLDPVRVLSNRSSGRMGVAIARAARRRGAAVTLVAGPMEVPPPTGVEVVRVETAAEMAEAVLGRAEAVDAVVMAAAVADYRPVKAADQKIKKVDGEDGIRLDLVRNLDILAELGRRRRDWRTAGRRGPVLVGFAAETADLVHHARAKLAAKGVDLIVANDVSAPGSGFGSETNAVVLVRGDGTADERPLAPKSEVADAILDRLRELVAEA
ncbi:MAG TPA: bifunctional phosphopantothenoylcysteine decarboxylase/phosphopantothenate--cysteine ligase CoaBC [Thermodesulfobacteriota bacterium]